MERFDGTRVLLTGGGSGIGRATALRLVAEGAQVCALDLSAEGLAATAEAATAQAASAQPASPRSASPRSASPRS
uniref:SDR family NAD(P)-dependent oxidoreductase n=1 Tax=Streptomyces xiaopingdaonensis TaxID=1565415 RepID=UPI00049498FB